MHVPEQLVAELQPRTHQRPVGAQVRARRRLQQLLVVDERATEVAGEEVHQVEALAALHPHGVGGLQDVIAAVVEVDVQVGAVPAVGGRVEAPRRGRTSTAHGLARRPASTSSSMPLELAARGRRRRAAGRPGRAAPRGRVGVEERPVVGVPLGAGRRRRTRPRRSRRVTDQRAPCGLVSRSVAAAAGTVASTVHRAGAAGDGDRAGGVDGPSARPRRPAPAPRRRRPRRRGRGRRVRVEHHVDLDGRAGDHRPRRAGARGEPAVRADRHQREPGRARRRRPPPAPPRPSHRRRRTRRRPGPSRENRAHRNMSGNASSPQPTPCSARIRR